MPAPGSWRGVVAHFKRLPQAQQWYFEHLPKLAEYFPWDVSLAYQFARVELAHNMTLYCAAVKLHRAHPDLAWVAIQNHHLTRDSFKSMIAAILGEPLPREVTDLITGPEDVRDRIMHGKAVSEPKKREAVCAVLDYAVAYNEFVNKAAGVRPFGDLRGFKGRGKSLDKPTTRWLLKGMGLTIS